MNDIPALSVSNLTKTYKNGPTALRGISFDVAQGEFFGLLGPNGAGKSTTIGILTSLVNKSGGQVKIFGYDLDVDPAHAKLAVGLVPQEFNFSIFDTCEAILIAQAGYYGIPRKIAIARAEKLLKQLGLWEKRHTQSRLLSGGMKRRLMIARGLIHEPKLLILDEPTAGVDIELRRSMWQLLKDINAAGTTIILTTHYLEEAESLCKRIGIIDSGEIIQNTTTKDLIQTLASETFILDLQAPIYDLPQLGDYHAKLTDSTTIEVEVQQSQTVNTLFNHLSDQGITVLSMRNKANRLEELFLKLTQDASHQLPTQPDSTSEFETE